MFFSKSVYQKSKRHSHAIIYIRCIQKVFRKYSESIQKVSRKYPESIQKVFRKYSESIQKVFRKYSESIQTPSRFVVLQRSFHFMAPWCALSAGSLHSYFPNHVQSIEFTTGGFQSRCIRDDQEKWEAPEINSKGSEYLYQFNVSFLFSQICKDF